jgi:hypothetical protein
MTPGEGGGPQDPFTERLSHAPVGARVPEHVAPGVFCTGVIALEGQDEFVLDFVQGMGRPPRVGARVVLNARVMGLFVEAFRENIRKYEQAFGPPKEIPRPPTDRRPSIPEIYQDLKLADQQLSGTYATTVMISHSPAEFLLDFITRFYPTAAVASRVYVSASHAPRLLETLTRSLASRRRRRQQGGGEQPPPKQPPQGPQQP